jgi:DNA processing protein
VTSGRDGDPDEACGACLRRAWLLSRLSAWLEIAHARKQPLRDALALDDRALVAGLCGERAPELLEALETFDPEPVRRAAREAGLATTCCHRDAYPARLLDERAPAAALFLLGGADPVGRSAGVLGDAVQRPPVVGVVGTRRAGQDGLELARALGRGLAAAGVTVLSGMALGIDGAAHAGALEANGRTVAVLGGGADVPYPASKAALHRRIAATGLVVGELPAGSRARRWSFPARNRLIAALCDVLVVVEAAERSGSLITADLALDLGREVCAVPGPVLSWRSSGTNALLREGATLVRGPGDVLELLGREPAEPAPLGAPPDLPAPLARVLAAVEDGADTVAALSASPADAAAAAAALAELEVLGLVVRGPGGRYRRAMPGT